MSKKIIVLIAVFCILSTAIFLIQKNKSSKSLETDRGVLSPKEGANYLQERGEALYKRDYYLPQIAVYQKMLEQYPDSVDLRKKLADAYRQIGKDEEAQRLLDEINKKAPPP